ncbi:MAG: NAD(P)H-binding protein [Actinomycetota bacterium]|nr:NAD(P)H-binding protein [Actinomycetota bacterium]MDQ6945674.1 NAD(P)H-binding protein [Actinomycetota bacterium]
MKVLVTGATGFVGSHLGAALVDAGHDVRGLTRRPESYHGPGVPVGGDIGDLSSLRPALDGCEAAYYLVHSLDSANFADKDRCGAEVFGDAAAAAGVQQLIYLGGLGKDDETLSAHLASRREVEGILAARVPTTVLRAGIVIGDGGISWEILCQLVARLPVMVTPRWVQTRTQPVAIDDAVAFLVGVLGNEEARGEVYDVGGPEALTYGEMLKMVARMPGGILKLVVPVPLLTPRLSSHWLRLVTDVDLRTARVLIDSMSNEVIVRDRRIEQLTGHLAMTFQEAAERALRHRANRLESRASA